MKSIMGGNESHEKHYGRHEKHYVMRKAMEVMNHEKHEKHYGR